MASLPFLGSGSPPPGNVVIPEISQRINAFTLDLLMHYAQGDKANGNAILSPQGIFQGLAMSYIASGGATRRELAGVLHFPDDDERLVSDVAELRRQLDAAKKSNTLDVSVANAMWLDGTYAQFRPDYVKRVEKAFSASLHSTQFRDATKASAEINRWVSEKTRGKITRAVGPGDFKSKSRPGVIDEPALVSVNAVYFKADWGSRFDKGATRPLPFHVDPQTAQNVPMMHQRSLLAYAADKDFQFLEIPYVEGRYSMYVFLPRETLGVKELVSRVTAERVIALKRASAGRNVDVLLPKFEVGSHYDVKQSLAAMGVRAAFDEDQADFDKMIVKRPEAFRVYINSASHDAWIEVYEEGTKAAAATATTHYSIGCSTSPGSMPVAFHADHPFLFAIVDNKSYDILFGGWIVNPGGR